MPYDPGFDNEKPFNTPATIEGTAFNKEFEVRDEEPPLHLLQLLSAVK